MDETTLGAIWNKAEKLAMINDEIIKVPRQGKMQTQRSNVPVNSAKQYYYHRSVYVPFLDHVLAEFESHF